MNNVNKYYSWVLFLVVCSPVIAGGLKQPVYILPANYRFCKYQSQTDLPTLEELTKSSLKDWNADFRSCDLSQMDLSMYPSNLADYVDFDSKTKWPAKDKMPAGFNPKKYLKVGRNPGLHVRDLHKRGIDGRGVAVAIIDQPLLYTQQEYKKQMKLYHDNDVHQGGFCLEYSSGLCGKLQEAHMSSMHGPAVASIAVGKTVGVAPKADLYYFSAQFSSDEQGHFDARPITAVLQQIMNLNNRLPEGKRILIVSISRGFSSQDVGAEEFQETVQEMNRRGIGVFTTDDMFTVSRKSAYADADENAVYTRAAPWWQEAELPNYAKMEDILFPSDYRVTAAPNGDKDYVAYSSGGLSWAVPYAAGLYALSLQVFPDLTPEFFWQVARETAAPAQVQGQSGKMYPARYLVQPVKLIEKLESLKK